MSAKHVLCGLLLCLGASGWAQNGYDFVRPVGDGVSIVCKSDKYGLVDAAGTVVLPLQYNRISPWGNGLLLLQKVRKKNETFGLADHTGRIVQEVKYSMISRVNCYGKAIACLKGWQYGILNADGNVCVPPQYRGLFEFSAKSTRKNYPYGEGRYLRDRSYCVTDTLETDCRYLGFRKYSDNPLNAGVIDSTGHVLIEELSYSWVMYPSEGMIRYYKTKDNQTECGYYNIATGSAFLATTINMKMADIKGWSHLDFTGDIALVAHGAVWAFIDKTGQRVRDGYSHANYDSSLQLWRAKKGEKWEVFDFHNADIAALSGYERIYFPEDSESRELFGVQKGDRWGYIDRKGQVVIPFEYDYVNPVRYNECSVVKADKMGQLTVDNKVIFPTEYISSMRIKELNPQHYWVQKADSLWYQLRRSDGHVAPTGYRSVVPIPGGFSLVQPVDLDSVSITPINRAQQCEPFATSDELAEAAAKEMWSWSGYLLAGDGTLFEFLITEKYADLILDLVSRRGNATLTDAVVKRFLLEATRPNRSYSLYKVIDETEWDY